MKIMSENTTEGALMLFGVYKGELIEEIPDGYPRWLHYQGWFEENWSDLFEKVEDELRWRDYEKHYSVNGHVFD